LDEKAPFSVEHALDRIVDWQVPTSSLRYGHPSPPELGCEFRQVGRRCVWQIRSADAPYALIRVSLVVFASAVDLETCSHYLPGKQRQTTAESEQWRRVSLRRRGNIRVDRQRGQLQGISSVHGVRQGWRASYRRRFAATRCTSAL